MYSGKLWLIGITAFIILGIYASKQEKKKYFKLYTDAFKTKR